MSAILDVRDLRVSYGAVEALRGISLVVNEGEIVTLLGANGAGKSSLLRAIMSCVPYRGDIFYQGASIKHLKTNRLVRKGIALVPEGRGILGSLTVLENLEMGAFHRGEWRSELDSLFQLFPILKDRLKQLAGTLSGGEQQMLALARALLSKPRILLLDEPSLGLAPKMIQQVFSLVKQIQSENITILLIEQNAHMALKIASRAYILETGSIAAQGTAAEIEKNDDLRKAYLGG